jgi:hypothetical protein
MNMGERVNILRPSLAAQKKTFCAKSTQKVSIHGPLSTLLVSRTVPLRTVVLTATPDPEVIYSPLS